MLARARARPSRDRGAAGSATRGARSGRRDRRAARRRSRTRARGRASPAARSASSFEMPAMPFTRTPSRRSPSTWTGPMNPAPMMAAVMSWNPAIDASGRRAFAVKRAVDSMTDGRRLPRHSKGGLGPHGASEPRRLQHRLQVRPARLVADVEGFDHRIRRLAARGTEGAIERRPPVLVRGEAVASPLLPVRQAPSTSSDRRTSAPRRATAWRSRTTAGRCARAAPRRPSRSPGRSAPAAGPRRRATSHS